MRQRSIAALLLFSLLGLVPRGLADPAPSRPSGSINITMPHSGTSIEEWQKRYKYWHEHRRIECASNGPNCQDYKSREELCLKIFKNCKARLGPKTTTATQGRRYLQRVMPSGQETRRRPFHHTPKQRPRPFRRTPIRPSPIAEITSLQPCAEIFVFTRMERLKPWNPVESVLMGPRVGPVNRTSAQVINNQLYSSRSESGSA